MKQVVSITSQGQVTIPMKMREILGISGATKAVIERQGDRIIIEPKGDFWSLGGSLRSEVRLSDEELRDARKAFETQWPEK
jgi:AbrB family looped-hinge helix DNA binding protein